MKMLHTLKTSWLLTAMFFAVVVGETIAWQISRLYEVRISAFTVAAVCIALVALAVSFIYEERN